MVAERNRASSVVTLAPARDFSAILVLFGLVVVIVGVGGEVGLRGLDQALRLLERLGVEQQPGEAAGVAGGQVVDRALLDPERRRVGVLAQELHRLVAAVERVRGDRPAALAGLA